MATQIAPTPIVKGKEAVKIYNQANQVRTEASKKGAVKLMKKFSGKDNAK
jgi:hypothetical protein